MHKQDVDIPSRAGSGPAWGRQVASGGQTAGTCMRWTDSWTRVASTAQAHSTMLPTKLQVLATLYSYCSYWFFNTCNTRTCLSRLQVPAAAPAAPAAPMEADDPRIAWATQNRVALQQRAQAEASKKVEVLAKAKEHLEKVNKVSSEYLTVACFQVAPVCGSIHCAPGRAVAAAGGSSPVLQAG